MKDSVIWIQCKKLMKGSSFVGRCSNIASLTIDTHGLIKSMYCTVHQQNF